MTPPKSHRVNQLSVQQALVFAGLHYREDLLRVLVQLPGTPENPDVVDFRQVRLAKTAVLARMLRIIYHLPIEALCESCPPCLPTSFAASVRVQSSSTASTTLPGLLKIRYVASSLLNDLELSSPGPYNDLSDEDRIKAAHYLCKCLHSSPESGSWALQLSTWPRYPGLRLASRGPSDHHVLLTHRPRNDQ